MSIVYKNFITTTFARCNNNTYINLPLKYSNNSFQIISIGSTKTVKFKTVYRQSALHIFSSLTTMTLIINTKITKNNKLLLSFIRNQKILTNN
jgi:hypothetical protein